MWVLLIIAALLMTLIIWSCCVAASRADKGSTEIDSEVYRRKDNGKTDA